MSIDVPEHKNVELFSSEITTEQALENLRDAATIERYYKRLIDDCTNGTILPIITREQLAAYIGDDEQLDGLVKSVFAIQPQDIGVTTDNPLPHYEEANPDGFTVIAKTYTGPDGKERKLAPKYLPNHIAEAFENMNQAYLDWLSRQDRADLPVRPGLLPKSGYRSPAYQAILALRTIHEDGLDETLTSLMPPGFSQHNKYEEGAVDVLLMGDDASGSPKRSDGTKFEIDETIEFVFLIEEMANYGFWLPYHPSPDNPTGNLTKSGIIVEPWHLQYVGVEEAKRRMAKYKIKEVFIERHRLLRISTPLVRSLGGSALL